MKSTMKILSVVEAKSVNAVARVVLDFFVTARELASSGDLTNIEGSLVTFDRASDQSLHANDFLVAARVAGLAFDVITERRRFDFRVIDALKTIVAQRQPDLVVTNSVKSHFLMWRSRLWKDRPWVAFHHGYTTTDRKMRLYNRFDRWSLPKADLVVTVCDAFARELTASIDLSPDKIRVQHNSILPSPPLMAKIVRAVREKLNLAEDALVVLSVGRLSREKGHADLVAAFTLFSEAHPATNCKLVIVGDGPERESLQAAAHASGHVQRIIFTGQLSDVRPLYAMANVFVLPSHSEGSPNVLLEAMAAKVPVVATAVGGVPEIVEHDRSALLVAANDPPALAKSFARVLAEPELAERLTSFAFAQIVNRHTPEQYVKSLVRIYEDAVSARR
jgi:glycosyltransferase involved in cell wall biosynthesis